MFLVVSSEQSKCKLRMPVFGCWERQGSQLGLSRGFGFPKNPTRLLVQSRGFGLGGEPGLGFLGEEELPLGL